MKVWVLGVRLLVSWDALDKAFNSGSAAVFLFCRGSPIVLLSSTTILIPERGNFFCSSVLLFFCSSVLLFFKLSFPHDLTKQGRE